MPTLPANPDLDQLRRQAKELVRAAKAGDADALRRIRAVSDRLALDSAQLALAREYGFASWPGLKNEVEARSLDLAQKVDIFCRASVGNQPGRAVRLLAENPAIADYNLATAAILGDVARVRSELEHEPGLATRLDPRSGWTALHAACASRWHHLEPSRADGLLAVVRLLLDAGADPTSGSGGGRTDHWSPLRCAVAGAGSGTGNEPIVRLLLERGAVPDDHDLYLAGFAADAPRLLRLLVEHVPNLAHVAGQALAAPVSTDDTDSARILLEAGADPRRYADDDGRPASAAYEAVRSGCSADLLALLLGHHADADAPGPDDRSPYRLAVAAGRHDLAELLRQNGAADDTTDGDRFISACLSADRTEAQRLHDRDPGLLDTLTEDERGAIVRAAESGHTDAVALMLDLGFPLELYAGEHGCTPLHAAAYTGSADTVRLLLDRGADLEARDTRWKSTPLGWAAVGSGERARSNPTADWLETVRVLLAAGAATGDISLSPDDAKPPSREVAELLRASLQ